jgi:hypothetical protein
LKSLDSADRRHRVATIGNHYCPPLAAIGGQRLLMSLVTLAHYNEITLATANTVAITEDQYIKATPTAALTILFKWLPSEVFVTVFIVPRTTP